jgi:hypothetical protein
VVAQLLVADPLAGERLISFRYHVISIAAVFLALVLGIVVGSTVVPGPLVDSLRTNIKTADRNLQSVSDENKQLSGELGRYQEVAGLATVARDADRRPPRSSTSLFAAGGRQRRCGRCDVRADGARIVEDVRFDDSCSADGGRDVAGRCDQRAVPTPPRIAVEARRATHRPTPIAVAGPPAPPAPVAAAGAMSRTARPDDHARVDDDDDPVFFPRRSARRSTNGHRRIRQDRRRAAIPGVPIVGASGATCRRSYPPRTPGACPAPPSPSR